MKPERVRLKDVADALGLDRSTVNHALKETGTVSDETRRRVKDKAAEMGYVRNRHAAGMVKQGSPTIGLVLPNSLSQYGELQQYLQWEAQARGCELHVALTEFAPEREDEAVRNLLESQVGALFIKTFHGRWKELGTDEALWLAYRQGVPVVTFDGKDKAWGFPVLATDEVHGFRLLAEHLHGSGFARVGYFPDLDVLMPRDHRLVGMRKAWRNVAAKGIAVLPAVIPGNDRQAYRLSMQMLTGEGDQAWLGAHVRRILRALCGTGPRTAVVCPTEFIAMRCILEARRIGLHVPDDLGVAALTRTEYAAALHPDELTALFTPAKDLARAAFEIISTPEQTGGKTMRRTVAPRLAIGTSTINQP